MLNSLSKVYCMKQLKYSSHSALDSRQLIMQLLTCHVSLHMRIIHMPYRKVSKLKKIFFHGQIYNSYAMQMEDILTLDF